MQLTNLFDENDGRRAVSPVIGVILMVAITVILAAVIGTFVLGLGGQVEETPQASLSFDGDADNGVTVEHRGGDSFDYANIEVRGSALSDSFSDPFSSTSDTFDTGDVVEISSDGTNIDPGTITLVYVGGEREAIIGSYEVE